ncbi:MAG: hypothetical protein ACTSVL_00885, partial [Promethearchaeota archaeon]
KEKGEVDQLSLLLNKLKSKSSTKNKTSNLTPPPVKRNIVPPAPPKQSRPFIAPLKNPIEAEVANYTSQKTEIKESHNAGNTNQKSSAITDLKIKIANVNKTLLDLEMQNIMGDLSDEDFQSKKAKLESIRDRFQQQIDELSNL